MQTTYFGRLVQILLPIITPTPQFIKDHLLYGKVWVSDLAPDPFLAVGEHVIYNEKENYAEEQEDDPLSSFLSKLTGA